jgi:thiol-disulfide isomerase/thioredoxin
MDIKKDNELNKIYNNTTSSDQTIFDAFNSFIFSKDKRIISKMMYRYELVQKVKHLPGDIVEIGVFKGSGIATWCKYCDMLIPNSNKKVIGFDIFGLNPSLFNTYKNGNSMIPVLKRVPPDDILIESVRKRLLNANIQQEKFILVEGDVCKTTKSFAKENPGFRISLLYLDLDLDEPTYETLQNLWDRVVPGGYIVFDEYDYHYFDESNGVDRFLKERNLKYTVCSTNICCPSAYIVKE